MTYFNTPATYKNEGSVIFPTSHQEYKQKQKSDYGQFNSMEYSGYPSHSQYKPNQYLSSWGSAKNNVIQYNPSIVKDGMVIYHSKNLDRNGQSTTSMTTESGRRISVEPELLNKTTTANRSSVAAFPYLEPKFFSNGLDFTDTDTNHSQKTVSEYFNKYNQFQTQDFTTPGTKTVKLESGRVITYEIKPEMKDIARCPRPQENNLEITPNKYAYNVDEYSAGKMAGIDRNQLQNYSSNQLQNQNQLKQYPISALSGANIPDNIYPTQYSNLKKLNSEPRDYLEQSLQQPKLLIPNNNIETKKQNVYTTLTEYMPKSEGFNSNSKINSKEQFGFDKQDMADELYKQILRTSAKAICDFLLEFKPYKPWINHWKILESNLKKTNLNITKLSTNDKEIAYTLDKGEIIKFRWEDNKRYVPKDVYMYVLLHELTHESFPPTFQGHDDPFPQMLCLLCVAATELGILDIQNIPKNIFMSNGRPITSRDSIKSEILFGIDMLMEANKNDPKIIEYYTIKKQYVNKYS